MTLLGGLAAYLSNAGFGTYTTTGTYAEGDTAIVFEHIPQSPAHIIALTLTGGNTVPSGQTVDEPTVQIRVRGDVEPGFSTVRAQAIYDEFHGLAGVELPGGPYLVLAVCTGRPTYMGRDSNNRHEHVLNMTLSVDNPNRRR